MTSLLKERTVENILEKDNKAMFYGNPLDYTTEDIDEVIEYLKILKNMKNVVNY